VPKSDVFLEEDELKISAKKEPVFLPAQDDI
jgi:hypothetical protein